MLVDFRALCVESTATNGARNGYSSFSLLYDFSNIIYFQELNAYMSHAADVFQRYCWHTHLNS